MFRHALSPHNCFRGQLCLRKRHNTLEFFGYSRGTKSKQEGKKTNPSQRVKWSYFKASSSFKQFRGGNDDWVWSHTSALAWMQVTPLSFKICMIKKTSNKLRTGGHLLENEKRNWCLPLSMSWFYFFLSLSVRCRLYRGRHESSLLCQRDVLVMNPGCCARNSLVVWGSFDGSIFMVLHGKSWIKACVGLHQGLPSTTHLQASLICSLHLHCQWKCRDNSIIPCYRPQTCVPWKCIFSSRRH